MSDTISYCEMYVYYLKIVFFSFLAYNVKYAKRMEIWLHEGKKKNWRKGYTLK